MPPLVASVSRTAVVAGAVFALANLLAGENFPFSRYGMYADLEGYTEAAVIVFRADGQPAEPEAFTRFTGDALLHVTSPQGVRCSMGWRVFESRRWMETHAAPAGDPPGPVRFQVGYVMARLGAGGPEVDDAFVPLAEGAAWPAP